MRGVLLVAAVAVLASVAAPAAAGTVEVRLVDARDEGEAYNFRPSKLTVPPGTTVRWVNDEDVFHTVTSSNSTEVRRPNGMFDARLAGKGETFEHTFDAEGEFPYYCKPHSPFMYAVVRVREGAPPDGVGESLDGAPADGDAGGENEKVVPGPPGVAAFAAVLLAASAARRRS